MPPQRREMSPETMEREKLAAELAAGEKMLRSATVARLAYNGTDGTPRVIPVGFLWTGEAVIVCTHPTAPKVAALRARPRVALTIDTPRPARSLLARGDAEIDVIDGVPPEYLAAAAKSYEGEDLAAFEAGVRATYDRMARISIVPHWARWFDFDAGPLPGFLRRLT
jgi:hypothetical protein